MTAGTRISLEAQCAFFGGDALQRICIHSTPLADIHHALSYADARHLPSRPRLVLADDDPPGGRQRNRKSAGSPTFCKSAHSASPSEEFRHPALTRCREFQCRRRVGSAPIGVRFIAEVTSLAAVFRPRHIRFRLIELFAGHFESAAIRAEHFDPTFFFFVEKTPGRVSAAVVAQRFARAFFPFNKTYVQHGMAWCTRIADS
jgi:hypothetical protein